jgi:LPS O-antigen subunit length determinant protein (WzzB/FepE family)
MVDLKKKEYYLTEKLKSTLDVNVSKSVGFLVQGNIRMQMVANTSDYYFFKVVSSPNLPYKKVAPRRAVICILFFITGFLLTLIIITLRDFFSSKLDRN